MEILNGLLNPIPSPKEKLLKVTIKEFQNLRKEVKKRVIVIDKKTASESRKDKK